jgi:hypothetical protein
MADAISYTAATGKRPRPMTDGGCRWSRDGRHNEGILEPLDAIPFEVFVRLEGNRVPVFCYDTESDALKAADEAYLRAVADGAMAAIGEGVA